MTLGCVRLWSAKMQLRTHWNVRLLQYKNGNEAHAWCLESQLADSARLLRTSVNLSECSNSSMSTLPEKRTHTRNVGFTPQAGGEHTLNSKTLSSKGDVSASLLPMSICCGDFQSGAFGYPWFSCGVGSGHVMKPLRCFFVETCLDVDSPSVASHLAGVCRSLMSQWNCKVFSCIGQVNIGLRGTEQCKICTALQKE